MKTTYAIMQTMKIQENSNKLGIQYDYLQHFKNVYKEKEGDMNRLYWSYRSVEEQYFNNLLDELKNNL